MTKRLASLSDLKMELWLRRRCAGDIVWVTESGRDIPIKSMCRNHLINAINMIEGNNEMSDHIGDYDPLFDED